MPEHKAGIFDVGGVLHSNEMPHVKEDIINTLGIPEDVFTEAWRELSPPLGVGEVTEQEFWEKFLERVGSNAVLPEQSLFVRGYEGRMRIHEEVFGVVEDVRERGIRLAILSNTIEAHVDYLSQKGLFDWFDIRIFSNEVGLAKPDSEIYVVTLGKLGLDGEECFFVDDRQENVDAARELGIAGILYENPDQLRDDLIKLGVLK